MNSCLPLFFPADSSSQPPPLYLCCSSAKFLFPAPPPIRRHIHYAPRRHSAVLPSAAPEGARGCPLAPGGGAVAGAVISILCCCLCEFSNLCLYKRKGWMAQGKKPVRHHDTWEEIYQPYYGRTPPISMTHVYGHKRLVYNEKADALAKAGAVLSKVHLPRRVMDMLQSTGHQTKVDQGRGIKRQAAVRVSDDNRGSDAPAHIRHRRREMRHAPLDIPDSEPD